ncbi:MAG: tetratricopeptide repeat protein [candidate division Zixibacteria bacterium]|nr:tetratricopeptide repeat protein [candidate division Zixibacteria bacterium]
MKTLTRLAGLLTVGLVLIAPARADIAQLFADGNRQYETKHYDSAIVSYSSILDEGQVSAAVYFNLGNAYFRSGDLGRAVLNYMRARRLDPSNDDIQTNLDFARRFTSIQMEGVKLNPVTSFLESIVAPYHLDLLAWIAAACFVLFVGMLIVRYGLNLRGSPVRVGITISLTLLMITSFLTTFKYNTDYLTQHAVILTENSIVRTGPSELSDKELDAAPGLIVEVLSESGDYYNVLFENKRRGWVRKDLVAVI